MKTWCIIPAFFISLSATADDSVESRLYVNGQPHDSGALIEPGAPALLELEFFRPNPETGKMERLNDFQPMHMKFMHLVLIREDFTRFAHVHPSYDRSTGLFQVMLNLPTRNPDNQTAPGALPEPGRYFAVAELKSRELGMAAFRFDLDVGRNRSTVTPSPDPASPNGGILKYFDTLGEPAGQGGEYRLVFSTSTTPGCGGNLVRFHFDLTVNDEGVYAETGDFENWMMMGGHAILLHEEGDRAVDRTFLHLHADLPPVSSQFEFSHFDRGNLKPGTYRMWAQFRRKDRVLTFPVTFEFEPEPVTEGRCR